MSIWHWVVVGLIVMLLFGRGKISEMMGDVAKGIKAFKKGMSEDETVTTSTTTVPTAAGTTETRTIEHRTTEPTTPATAGADRKIG